MTWITGSPTGGKQAMLDRWSPVCESNCNQLIAAENDPQSAWHCDKTKFDQLWQCLSGNSSRCVPTEFCMYAKCPSQGQNGCFYKTKIKQITAACCTQASVAAGQCAWFTGASASSPAPKKPPPPTASRLNPPTGTGVSVNSGQNGSFTVGCSGTFLRKAEWYLDGALKHTVAITGPNATASWSWQFISPNPFAVKAVCVDYVDQKGEVAWQGMVNPTAPTAPAPPTGYAPTGPTAPSGPAGPSGPPTAPFVPGGPMSPGGAPSGPPQPQTLQAHWPGFRQEVHGVGRGEALAVQNNCGANAAASVASWAKNQAKKQSGKTVCQIVNMAALKGKVSGRIGTHSCSNHRGRTHCRAQCYILGLDLPVTYLCQ